MEIITFASFKGGSGKSTTAIATAAALVDEGRRSVFLIDLDSRQTSLHRWLKDTREVHGEAAPDTACLDGISIDPDCTQNEAMDILHETLRTVSADYDVCIIDTQGTQNLVAVSAMGFSDRIVIPFQFTGIEIEPFVSTYSTALDAMKDGDTIVTGISTRMPNFASTTVLKAREVLGGYGMVIVEGTLQRDGYQQLVMAAGTFDMIRRMFIEQVETAPDGKARKRAENEANKIMNARADAVAMLGRLGIMDDGHTERATA